MNTLVIRLIPWGLLSGAFVLWNNGCSSEKPAFTEGQYNTGKANQGSDGRDLANEDSLDSQAGKADRDGEFIDSNGDGIDDQIANGTGGGGENPAGGNTGDVNNVTGGNPGGSAGGSAGGVAGGSAGGGSAGGMAGGTTGGQVDDTTINQYKNDCAMAAQKGLVKTFKQAVFFPAVRECPWDQGDNLSRLNGSIRARSEQYQNVQFPKLSRLCGMKFNFPTQNMEFDDEIFLLFGRYVVGSSQDYGAGYRNDASKGFVIDADGYETYSWLGANGLRNLYYDHGVSGKHCLPGTTCSMPLTETEGNMSVNIPDSEAIRLGLKAGLKFDSAVMSQELKIGFVTIGDNDNGDCRHLDFRFDVTFNYVE